MPRFATTVVLFGSMSWFACQVSEGPVVSRPREHEVARQALTPGFTGTTSVAGDVFLLPLGDGGVIASASANTAMFEVASNTWLARAPVPTPWHGFSCVARLPGDRLMRAGGGSTGSPVTTVRLYSSLTNTWTVGSSLLVPRTMAPCVDLADGRVLIAGGWNTRSAEIYDPVSDKWSLTGSPTFHRGRDDRPVRLLDGRVLFLENHPEVYDPVTGKFTVVGTYGDRRTRPAVALLLDGRVLIAGGSASFDSSVAIFDPATNTFTAAAPLSTPRAGAAAVRLATGRVVVSGGAPGWNANTVGTVEVYDPLSNTWAASADMAIEREDHRAAQLVDGSVLAVGGFRRVGTTLFTLGSSQGAEILQPTCSPSSCEPGQCGLATDGCGQALDCGTCSQAAVCSFNQCCTPTSCAAASVGCGPLSDGCGTLLDCGTCGAGFVCSYGACVACVPVTCASQGATCGTISDGCGGVLSCGTCSGSLSCITNTCSTALDRTAAYDSTHRAPACLTYGKSCDSAALLNGRGNSVSSEQNHPNTIYSTCADGTTLNGGPFLHRLKVATVDGSPLEAGKLVRIDATIYSANGNERLDLFYAANADAPSWQLIATLFPQALNLHTVSTTFTLPAGRLQAIRGNFRWGGSPAPCTSGEYDDRDDLIFAVLPDTQPPWVLLTMPQWGAIVRGNVSLFGGGTDDVALVSLRYFDGSSFIAASSPGYGVNWNSAAASDGPHLLTLQGFDRAGNHATSPPVMVTVDNTVPVTAVTAPAGGAVLRSTVNVAANAVDANGITLVELLLDGVVMGTDSAPPYTVVWDTTSATNGQHTLSSRATDGAGNLATSAGVTVTVDNVAPTTSVTEPASGAIVHGAVTVTATATDDVGVVAVELYDGTTLIGSVAAPPYAAEWNTVAAGEGAHQLRSIAYDAAGNSTASAWVEVTVSNVPSTQVTSPQAGAFVSGTVTLAADAFALDGRTITLVELLVDGTVVGTDDTAPYSVSWNSRTTVNGAHSVTSRATDSAGFTSTSAGVGITTDNDFTPPLVTVTAPPAAALVRGSITLAADASDPNGIAWVDFYVDGQLAGSVASAPYELGWNSASVADGAHTVMARAFDTAGNPADSSVVLFSTDNTAPSVSLSAPNPVGQQVVGITATASDGVAVARVDFYDGASLIGSDTSSPWEVAWNTIGLSGMHVLTAVAFDSAGNAATSAGVSVTVLTAQTAVYESVLKAPRCAALGVSCDTGASLVLGRGNLGPEPNKPNTINATCADGNNGTFHVSGESLDRLSIATTGGGGLVPGAQVRVTATIWAVNSNDRLDIFRAANANSPSWVLVGTLTPTVLGAPSSLQLTYTLPNGALQAVRGQLRRNGSAVACSSGSNNDRDDLVFATQ